jgi:high-affinity Fe2+/Pb2+ permease
MLFFRILLVIDALVALVVAYFFVVGIADSSVSSFNITLWLGMLAIVAAVLGGGWMLNKSGQRAAANTVLAILAIPGLLFGVFILAAIILQPNWH